MKNNRSILMLLSTIMFLALVLVGCGRSSTQQADATNAYRLPLGDSGYINEMDFKFYNCYAYSKNTNGVYDKWVNYKYLTTGEMYTVNVEFGKVAEEAQGKCVKFYVGTYDENDNLNVVAESNYITLSSTEFVQASFAFVAPSDIKTVLKLSFGTNVDEAYYKEQNEGAKKSEIRKYKNTYRGSEFVIRSIDLVDKDNNTNSLLYETVVNKDLEPVNVYVGKQNSDLYYYNTATVSWNDSTRSLTLKLNYKKGAWQWLVAQLGALLSLLTKWLGGAYWAGLLIFTMAVRTIAWPIYAKSNSMSTKMAQLQPEIQKINAKYEGKTDQNSKMKQQMETKQLMKKNHVSTLGCLLPFLQMPIFIAVYQVAQRFPLTPLFTNGVNFNFLWTNFGASYGVVTGDWILALLVGVTMIGSQEINTIMSKRIQAKKRNFYTQKDQQSNNQMRIMMIFMTVMMVVFAWRSAGLAFYWIVGNLYQIMQTFLTKLQEEKRADKEAQLKSRPIGR